MRDAPLLDDPSLQEVQHGDASFAAVGDVEKLGIAADVKAVRTSSGPQKADLRKTGAVDLMDPVQPHIRDVENPAVRR